MNLIQDPWSVNVTMGLFVFLGIILVYKVESRRGSELKDFWFAATKEFEVLIRCLSARGLGSIQ